MRPLGCRDNMEVNVLAPPPPPPHLWPQLEVTCGLNFCDFLSLLQSNLSRFSTFAPFTKSGLYIPILPEHAGQIATPWKCYYQHPIYFLVLFSLLI